MSGRRDPPAGAWLCDALCFPSATALRERLAADEQRRPLLGSPRLGGGDELSVSELRWWALIVFSTMSAVQNAVWISFSVVVEPACGFFSVDTSSINFLASLGPLVLIPVAFITGPLSRSMGLRAVVVIGCALTALGAVLRVPAIFLHHHRYAWAVLGHAVNAAAGPVIMSCPPLLSSTWFPLHERTTATAIAYNAQIFGIAFGWAAGPYIVTQASEIPRLIWLEAAFGIATLLVGVTFPPAPATAPTVSAGEERVGFWAGVAILLRRPAFMGLAALWSISAGVNGGWATLLDVFLEHKQSQVQIGWIGFGGSLAGAAGGVVAGVLIDRFDQSLKWGMVTLYAGATAAAAVFLVFVYLLFRELQFVPIFLSVLFCGLFANAAAPITLELASELTFPVGEETSATLLVVFFSVVQLAFIEGSSVISPEVMNWVNAGVLGAATIGLLLVPGDSMRKAVDVADVKGGNPVAVAEVERLLRHSDSALPVHSTTPTRAGSDNE